MNKIYLEKIDKTINLDKLANEIQITFNEIIFLSGSVIESLTGLYSSTMGNKYSDVDIFMFVDDLNFKGFNGTYNGKLKKVFFKEIDNVKYDIEVYPMSQIEFLINAIKEIFFDSEMKVSNSIKLGEDWDILALNSLLNRILYSKCIKGINEFDEIKSRINWNNFRKLYAYYVMNQIDNDYEDLLGAIDSKNKNLTLYSIRMIFLNMCKLCLYYEGEFVDRDKWVFTKFENMAKAKSDYLNTLKMYYRIYWSDLSKDKEFYLEVNDCLEYINEIIMELEYDKQYKFIYI